jgi:hypothetical protein
VITRNVYYRNQAEGICRFWKRGNWYNRVACM